MRINVYSQELTSEVVAIEQVGNGQKYVGARIYLHSPHQLHNEPEDDDRSAVTFWRPTSAYRREEMAKAFELMAAIFRSE